MNRGRAAIIALTIAIAAVAGVFAVGHSLALGTQARTTTDAQVARRSAQLDRYQASLAAALSKRPPALPRAPSSTAGTVAQPVRVVYRRAVAVASVSGGGGDDEGWGGGSDD